MEMAVRSCINLP